MEVMEIVVQPSYVIRTLEEEEKKKKEKRKRIGRVWKRRRKE
jgi:hypothetical protein